MDWSQGESTGTSPETGTCPTQRDKYTCTICHCIKHLIFKKKKKLQRILIWKLNFRIKSEIIIMIIYTYRYMIFRYSNLKIDMNKYWYLAALKKKHLHCKCTYTGTYMYITYSLPCPSGCGHTLSGGARDGWPLYSGTGQSRG